MRSAGDKPAVLDVVPPTRRSRSDGVSVAGFRIDGPGRIELRAIPHPAVTLALVFRPGTLVADDATGSRRGSLVAGLAFSDLRVRGQNVEAVQVRLSPLVAYRTLGVSPADLEGAVVTLDDLWGGDAARMEERLSLAPSWQDRFAMTDNLIARRRTADRAGPSMPAEVARAWELIGRSRGPIRVETLAAEVGWSRKRLWSRFPSHIGLTPGRAAQLVRFHHAAHWLAAGRSPAHTAAESGYFDQSHLHRNVRLFAGVTPATLAGEPCLAVDDIAWPGHAPSVAKAQLGTSMRWVPMTDSSRSASSDGEPGTAV